MNKYKKIAMAAVATVMAGSMVFSFAACSNKKPADRDYNINWDVEPELAAAWKPQLDDNGKLSYTKDSITLNMNVGNQNSSCKQSITYQPWELSGSAKMIDGKEYSSGKLKPAWQALSETLKMDFNDLFQNEGSGDQIKTPVTNNQTANYDLISGSLDAINNYSDYFIDLNDYVYYMPNYKAFLQSNPVTVFSLTGGDNGEMFALPYFDGNDDIEKYELAKREWVVAILDGDVSAATTTFAAQATAKTNQGSVGTKSAVESYMGKTGKWTIVTTKPGDEDKTLTVTVDYDAALKAAKDGNSDLGKALTAAGVTDLGALTSGNIVDLQNAAINATSGGVTGAQLANILKEYVKVTYKDGNKSFYNGTKYGNVTTKLSDVFNSSYGAWDVDLLTGLTRCVVTGIELFDQGTKDYGLSKLYGLAGRQDTTQRTVDLYALAGELYGIRGLESRYEYTYLDKDGKIHDNRQNADTYDLLAKMGAMADEGLLYICGTGTSSAGTATANTKTSYANKDSIQSFMIHDYVQTQTKPALVTTSGVADNYDFAPIVTPVSMWDTDSDGTRETVMRFTESWRSVKNTGFCIPKAAVEGKNEKLSAILSFIDYLFSSDGQILMTYGQISSNGNTNPNGWWYATESADALSKVADESVAATNYAPAQYTVKDSYKKTHFVYNGKVYEGMAYADRNIPIMTDANKSFYLGEQVGDVKQGTGNFVNVKEQGNYTNYARRYIGTTLPIGNKDQGFEYQATAACGLDGSKKVATAINNGTINHVKLNINVEESLWYLSVPTALPYNASSRATMTGSQQTLISGSYFYNNSKTAFYTNVYTDLVYYGFDATHYICGSENFGGMKENGAAYVAWLNGQGMTTRASVISSSWEDLDAIYNISKNK